MATSPLRAVGIKTLKNRLSEYVRLTAAGETALILDRDRVVAQLGPPRQVQAVGVLMPSPPMWCARG